MYYNIYAISYVWAVDGSFVITAALRCVEYGAFAEAVAGLCEVNVDVSSYIVAACRAVHRRCWFCRWYFFAHCFGLQDLTAAIINSVTFKTY